MSTLTCRACTARYAVGAPACPQCGSTDRIEEWTPRLPTIRVACGQDDCRYQGQVREVRLQPVGVGLVEVPALLCGACGTPPQTISGWPPTNDEQENDVPKITVHRGPSIDQPDDAEPLDEPAGEEESSPGTSSSTSSAKEQTSPEPSEQPRPSRARKTASRSGKARTGSSTARGTDGDQTAPTSANDDDSELDE